MKTLLLGMLLFASLGKAQVTGGSAEQPPPEPGPSPEKPVKVVFRRLESVSWNPVRAELTWLLSVWDPTVSTERPAGQERYVIHLDKAVMEFQEQARGFDTDEAKRVRSLMDVISRYALESTVWWGRGGGSTLEDHGTPSPKDGNGSNSKDAPDGNEDQPKPALKGTPIALRGK